LKNETELLCFTELRENWAETPDTSLKRHDCWPSKKKVEDEFMLTYDHQTTLQGGTLPVTSRVIV